MNKEILNDVPLSQKERLRFIESQLMWGRSFKARMLMLQFGISRHQALKDLTIYKDLFPNNVAPYDSSVKAYQPGKRFHPELLIGLPATNIEDCVLFRPPRIQRHVDTSFLCLILNAIENQMVMELIYASSSFPLGKRRRMLPTKMIDAANRLHFRAFCYEHNEYRDFVVSRCLTKPKLSNCNALPPADAGWEGTISFRVVINSELDEAGQRLVESEFPDFANQTITLPIGLFHYFLIDNHLPQTMTD